MGRQKEYSLSTFVIDDAGGPPVSIPNTEVKPCSAENSALATECENRKMPTHKGFHPVGWLFFYAKQKVFDDSGG